MANPLKQFICEDDDGDWYYFPEEGIYRRLKANELRSKIYGQYLPDPEFLLAQRKKLYPQASVHAILPTNATFALWKHWNATKEIADRA